MEGLLTKEHRGVLLGITKIEKPMRDVKPEERVSIARMCRDAVTSKAAGAKNSNPDLISKIETGFMGIQVVITKERLQLHCEDYMVSNQKINELSAIVALRGSDGHLVIIGNCQKRNQRVAFVLDMFSDQQANEIIQAIQLVKNTFTGSNTSSMKLVQPNQLVLPTSLAPVKESSNESSDIYRPEPTATLSHNLPHGESSLSNQSATTAPMPSHFNSESPKVSPNWAVFPPSNQLSIPMQNPSGITTLHLHPPNTSVLQSNFTGISTPVSETEVNVYSSITHVASDSGTTLPVVFTSTHSDRVDSAIRNLEGTGVSSSHNDINRSMKCTNNVSSLAKQTEGSKHVASPKFHLPTILSNYDLVTITSNSLSGISTSSNEAGTTVAAPPHSGPDTAIFSNPGAITPLRGLPDGSSSNILDHHEQDLQGDCKPDDSNKVEDNNNETLEIESSEDPNALGHTNISLENSRTLEGENYEDPDVHGQTNIDLENSRTLQGENYEDPDVHGQTNIDIENSRTLEGENYEYPDVHGQTNIDLENSRTLEGENYEDPDVHGHTNTVLVNSIPLEGKNYEDPDAHGHSNISLENSRTLKGENYEDPDAPGTTNIVLENSTPLEEENYEDPDGHGQKSIFSENSTLIEGENYEDPDALSLPNSTLANIRHLRATNFVSKETLPKSSQPYRDASRVHKPPLPLSNNSRETSQGNVDLPPPLPPRSNDNQSQATSLAGCGHSEAVKPYNFRPQPSASTVAKNITPTHGISSQSSNIYGIISGPPQPPSAPPPLPPRPEAESKIKKKMSFSLPKKILIGREKDKLKEKKPKKKKKDNQPNTHINHNEGLLQNYYPTPTTPMTKKAKPVLILQNTISPPPKTAPPSVQDTNDALYESDEDGEFIYEGDEYYTTLGMSVLDAERIFSKLPAKDITKQSPSLRNDINNFLSNEYNYLGSIERISKARNIFSPQLQTLLRGTEALYDTHNNMYGQLYAAKNSCAKIASVFISHQKDLEVYKYYMMNSPQINNNLQEFSESLKKSNPQLEEDIRGSWKRLHYYFMTFERMLGSASDEEKPTVTEAVEMLRDLHLQADSGILIDSVKDTPFDLHLRAPLRLHQCFRVTGVGLKGREFRVLLFSDIIVLTIPKLEKYEYQLDFRIEQTTFVNREQEILNFSLEVDYGGMKGKLVYTFKAQNEHIREVWFKEIKKLQDEHAEKVKIERNKRFGIQM